MLKWLFITAFWKPVNMFCKWMKTVLAHNCYLERLVLRAINIVFLLKQKTQVRYQIQWDWDWFWENNFKGLQDC